MPGPPVLPVLGRAQLNLDDYTPDQICRWLGLNGFRTARRHGSPPEELKVLLCPSFHPEVCLIFTEDEGQTRVRVLCAQSHIWTLDNPASVAVAVDESAVENVALISLEQSFRGALAQPDRRGSLVLDGMGVDVIWRHYSATLAVEGANPGVEDRLGGFLRDAIKSAFDAVSSAACREGLATAAAYVGLHLSPAD